MGVYRSSARGNTSGLSLFDDGTDYCFRHGSTDLFKIRKSDNQLLLDNGVDTDAF